MTTTKIIITDEMIASLKPWRQICWRIAEHQEWEVNFEPLDDEGHPNPMPFVLRDWTRDSVGSMRHLTGIAGLLNDLFDDPYEWEIDYLHDLNAAQHLIDDNMHLYRDLDDDGDYGWVCGIFENGEIADEFISDSPNAAIVSMYVKLHNLDVDLSVLDGVVFGWDRSLRSRTSKS